MATKAVSSALSKLLVGIVVLALVAGGLVFFLNRPEKKKVTADFASAVGVYPNSTVRILGITVGTVTKVTPQGDHVRVEMEYDAKYKVPANAVAVEVSNSLVSTRYIQLAPVYKGGEVMASGVVIPTERTAGPAELDDITSALNQLSVALGPEGANKNGALNDLLKASRQNLEGNGADLGNALRNLSKAAQTLSNGREDLFGTVKNLAAFTDALAQSDAQVRNFNEKLAEVSGELASEREALRDALRDLSLALTDVARFVRNNQDRLHDDLTGLKNITAVLVKQKDSLNEFLSVAPYALGNLIHSYNAVSGTLDSRSNLSSLTDPLAICGLLNQVGKLTKALLGIDAYNLCAALAGANGGLPEIIDGLKPVLDPVFKILDPTGSLCKLIAGLCPS